MFQFVPLRRVSEGRRRGRPAPTGAASLAHSKLTLRGGSMKTFRLFSVSMFALVLGIAFAGVSLAQTSSEEKAKAKVAVIEFTPGPNATGMTPEAKRQMQASLAFALFESKRFDVVDVRRTRAASQGDLAAINGGSSTAAAVKLGKQLGVTYVLTGTVEDYTPQGGDGFGRVRLKTRLIEVATGKVKHAGETAQRSTSAMRTSGASEMHTKSMRPALEKLAATLAESRS
jgi:TolB-like protein